jgi:hypothetical protein
VPVRFPLGAVFLSAGCAFVSGPGNVWHSAGHIKIVLGEKGLAERVTNLL